MQSRLGTSVYVDSNVWIYAVEGPDPWNLLADSVVRLNEAGALKLVSSQLSISEVLVAPIRDGNATLVLRYQQALTTSANRIIHPVDLAVLTRAASLRASTRLRLPDAIHLATALEAGCTSFITNDARHWPNHLIPIVSLDTLSP